MHYTAMAAAIFIPTQNEEYLCTLPLSQQEEKLIAQDFIRVHRSHMVNVRHIRAFEREDDHAFVIMACSEGGDSAYSGESKSGG